MPKTENFREALNKHLLANQQQAIFKNSITKWGLTAHRSTHDPTGAVIPATGSNSWYTNSSNRLGVAEVSISAPFTAQTGTNFATGAKSAAPFQFPVVGIGQTWNVKHFILWAVYLDANNNNAQVHFPLYYSTVSQQNGLELTSNTALYIAATQLTIAES